MKMKKLLACLMALVSTTAMVGCNDDNKGSTGGGKLDGIPQVSNPTEDFQAHYWEGGLHDLNVNYDAPANANFIRNKTSEYKIVTGNSTATRSANYIASQLSAATNVKLEVVEDLSKVSVDENSSYILVGCDDIFATIGMEMPTFEKLGNTGYYIVTYGKNVFIQAYGTQGYQLAGLCFLRQTVGFDIISTNITIFEKDGTVLPKMEITERPDYDYRQLDNPRVNGETSYGMGFTNGEIFRNTGTTWMHNVVDFLGGDVVLGKNDGTCLEHRGWFSNDANMSQACFTARGDREEYELMVQNYVDKTIGFMRGKDTYNIVIGQMDVINGDRVSRCTCDACVATYEYYGSTHGGAALGFLNDVSEGVDAYLASEQGKEEFGEHGDINVLMLVYGSLIKPPIEMDSNGNYKFDEEGKGIAKPRKWFNLEEDGSITEEDVLDEEGNVEYLKAAENVGFFYAAASANYVHSFYEAENAAFDNMVKGWSGLGSQFYIWTYELNYYNYLYPYNSYDSMLENMRYFKEKGAQHMYYQGQTSNPHNTGFDKLRTYITSKGFFNVNTDYEELLDKWFKYQYGPASEIMREYFDQVTQHLRANEAYTGGGIHSYDLAKESIWPEGLIRHWNNMHEEAYKAIASVATTNKPLYDAYKLNILAESLFPRYVLCTTYANSASFSVETIKKMRQQFADDFEKLGNTSHQEHYVIADVFNTWDLE